MTKKIPIWSPALEEVEEIDALSDEGPAIGIQYNPKTLLKDPFYKPNKVPSNSGIMHSRGPAPTVIFKKAEEEVYPSVDSPAQIVFGKDRPNSRKSGFGRASNRAASIDLVVGRMSSARKGKGVKDGTYVDNDFAADAARIHISQLTNIDKNFGIAKGEGGIMKHRSGIGIKADGVRIIGREGIKIVTGRAKGWKGFGQTGERNSLGGKIAFPAPPIELIAGNNTETRTVFGGLFNTPESYRQLQGVARGENTIEALKDLGKIVDEIWSAVFNFMIYQIIYNASLGPALSPLPAAPIVAGACSAAITAHINFSLNPLYHTRSNKTIWEANHLMRTGYRFIESRNVFST
tara:strand:- start:13115 stop:14158 length:1044 start_codon:yes stop_codon:yes gene_type:complete